jgi:hypothetical protein
MLQPRVHGGSCDYRPTSAGTHLHPKTVHRNIILSFHDSKLADRLNVQRLSSGEHKVNAYPTSGDVRYKTYSSWQDFRCAFWKYMDDPESKRLNAALDKTPCGIDVFESRASVSSAVLDSLGFEGT